MCSQLLHYSWCITLQILEELGRSLSSLSSKEDLQVHAILDVTGQLTQCMYVLFSPSFFCRILAYLECCSMVGGAYVWTAHSLAADKLLMSFMLR